MEEDQSTQCTQGVVDPRRMGRNNSGLSAADVADVMCILHPTTPAAFRLVAETSQRAPKHILQNANLGRHDSEITPSMAEESETFILSTSANNQALDLALRFSTETIQPQMGFVFGRNMDLCDIAVNGDVHKRVSNVHFTIYMNDSGVLMLKDMSTNGTMVDETLLKGKSDHHPKTRMLSHGSVVSIVSYNHDEILKFIVRLPSREGYQEQYEAQFRQHMARQSEAEARYRLRNGDESPHSRFAPVQSRQANMAVKAPMIQNQYGMHWSGGDKYNVVGQIGKGAFASVYQLATKRDGQLFAAKELEKRKFIKNGILDRKLENEMQIMQSISHRSIVQYYEHKDIQNHLYIIMEFVACGDLQQHLAEYGPLTEPMAKQMATQVFDALQYLHNKNITHRDIKPDNILIASLDEDNFVIKLSDFGLSKVVKNEDTFLKTFCGTLLYCAPEVFPHYDLHVAGQGTKRPRRQMPQSNKFHSYSQAVDIWSFGAVLWYSLCHKPPFEGVADNTGRGMFDKIMMTPLDAADLTRQGTSAAAVALLVQMLNTDPAARPSASYCMQHEWFGVQESSTIRPPMPHPHRELGVIAEMSEASLGAEEEVDVAGLNSQYSEVSLNESDYSFFDPRQSKRFKTNDMDYRGQQGEAMESSSEEYEPVPVILEEPEQEQSPLPAAAQSKPAKLFGEISRSDLPAMSQRPVVREGSPTQMNSNDEEDEEEPMLPDAAVGPTGASPSLLGAESLVRELNMDSPWQSHGDGSGSGSRPTSPKTPASVENDKQSQSQKTPAPLIDNTPKPPTYVPYDRRINIPLPPSYYWDPNDPSTHTVEYASKASGHDFSVEPVFIPNASTSMPSTTVTLTRPSASNSGRALGMNGHKEVAYPDLLALSTSGDKVEIAQPGEDQASSKSQGRFGRLVPTEDSFSQDVIELNDVRTSWGRAPENTVVYPDVSETRVPKLGIWVFFHAPGIEKLPEGEDFTNLPGLFCGIRTQSRVGLKINGVPLSKDDQFGKLHTGDEIEVWAAVRGKSAGLKYIAEIKCGQGKLPRAEDAPRFKIVKSNDAGSKNAAAITEEKGDAATA